MIFILTEIDAFLFCLLSRLFIYEKNNVDLIQTLEYISDRYGDYYKAYLTPITVADKSLLKYVDNMVPKVVLQSLFYKLNKVEVINDIKTLKKDK